MANRHANKKLRIAVRARMATTGESYQKALAQVCHLHEATGPAPASTDATDRGVDLVSIRYFGVPAALATIPIAGRLAVLVVSSAHHRGPFPNNPMVALGSTRTVH
jgi:hypothetical protein